MRAYLIRRLLLIIPTLFILTIIVFLAVRFIPGDAVDVILASMESSELAQRETLERMLGLDVPVYVQYGRWIGVLPTPDWVTGEPQFRGLLQGTFGDSMRGWSPSVALIPFKEDPPGESWDVPHSGRDSGDGHVCRHHADDAHHDAGGAQAGLYPHRLVQGAPGTGRDYPAHHQKCPHPGYHPIGLQLPILVGGAVIMENIFNLPGLGQLLVNALNDRDYPMVSGVNLFFATGVVLLNLLIDLIYPYLDPRVRYE